MTESRVHLSKSNDRCQFNAKVFTLFTIKAFIVITNPDHQIIKSVVKTNPMSAFIAL